jgi:GATA-binding protein, other eukaryote
MAESEDQPAPTQAEQSPNFPTQLHREPSQQELEAAQHLIEHSQGVPVQPSRELWAAAENGDEAYVGGEPREDGSDVHHDLSDVQAFAQSYPDPQMMQTPLPERRPPPPSMTPGGQMCRLVIIFTLTCEAELMRM